MCKDVDKKLKAWMESLEAATEQESKLQKDVKTMDYILLNLVSNPTETFRAI